MIMMKLMLMDKLYPNFNSLRISCACGRYALSDDMLKALAKQIAFECADLEEGKIRALGYVFHCNYCQKRISRNFVVERRKSTLIVY